jgi:signal transduction histidine kinase
MRLVPDSLAGRTALVLVAGLLLSLVASLATVLFLDRLLGIDLRYPRVIERVAQVAATLEQVPAPVRPRLLDDLSGRGLQVTWPAEPGPRRRPEAAGWRARHIHADLQAALPGLADGAVVIDSGRRGATRVWVQLSDGSWLRVALERDWLGPLWFLRFVLALAVLGAGITVFAVWAARRTTVPLTRFAEAAAGLGADVGAPPLPEQGPREIRAAAHAFNRMQERIRRLVEDRTQMLAAIAHDLRTALTRLRLRVELIEDEEQQGKAIADLEAMRVMLDETLAFARDEALAEARTEVDLAALVQSLVADLTDAGHAIRYQGPDRLTAVCRPVAIKRALANLMDNALRYGGGEVLVTLAEASGEIVVVVADRGPGIPEAEREQVFQPFHRLERSRSRETGGSGLGLAVARTIARRHGGEITLADRPGGGLLAALVLPAAA